MGDINFVLLLSQVVKLATPLLLAALGETMAESSGVIILALDGLIMLSALAAFVVAFSSGNLILGVMVGPLVGILLAAIFGYFVVVQRRDQFATGLIVGTVAIAISAYAGNPMVGKPASAMPDLPIPLLSSIPFLQPFFKQDIFVYLSYLAAIGLTYYLYRTRPGVTARAIGTNPESARRRGIPVGRTQYLYILFAGLMAGLAGAAFTLSTKPGWTQNHTLGWGWLALTLVIFGRRNPVWVTLGTYLFTLFSAAGIIQLFVSALPAQLTGVVPFVLMLIVLLITGDPSRSRSKTKAEA